MSDRHDYEFAVQLAGNLRKEHQPVSTRVVTSLRMMSGETASEIREYADDYRGAPLYLFRNSSAPQPLQAKLQAVGHHYFTW